MRTKADAREIVERLKKAYPLAECSLEYENAWQLLVSVRLSAQCTDARVNIVTAELPHLGGTCRRGRSRH